MPKVLISLTVLFLSLSAVLAILNSNKTRNLREVAAQNDNARAEAEMRVTREKKRAAEANATKPTRPPADSDGAIATAEAELIKSQSERADLHAQLESSRAQIAELQKRLDETPTKELTPDVLPMPGAGDLQTELEETRRQLDTAEREKQVLSEKIRTKHTTTEAAERPAKRRATISNPSLRGTVLAVNQAYNFVVLNVGRRQGVESNADMLVLRGGTLIGKIRVSSVEPATAIGDIVGSSLARGVQVQPGDIVVYAGTNF